MSAPSEPQIYIRPGASDQTLEFWWVAPLSDGGSPITGYQLESSGSTYGNWTFSNPGDASNVTISGLTFTSNSSGSQAIYSVYTATSGEITWQLSNTGSYKVGIIDVSQNYGQPPNATQLGLVANNTFYDWVKGTPASQQRFKSDGTIPSDQFKFSWDLTTAYLYLNGTLVTSMTRPNPGVPMRAFVKFDNAATISLFNDSYLIDASASYYRLTGLTNYQDYTFQLRAVNANGLSPAAVYRTVQPGFPAPTPTDISATRVGATNTALVTWQNGAYGGRIGWNVVSAIPVPLLDPSDVIVAPVEGYVEFKTVGGLDPTKSYKFLVQGVTDAAWGSYEAFSNTVVFDISGVLRALAFGGSATVIMKSDDGLTWTDTGTTVFTRAFKGAYDGSGRWVAVGTGANSIATSTDSGDSWTGLGTSVFDASGLQYYGSAVGFGSDTSGGTVWVAGARGPTNTLAVSTDGTTWTGLGNSIFSETVYSVKYGYDESGNGIWVAGGGNGSANTLANSRDGIHWMGLGNSIFDSFCTSIDYNGLYWVAVGLGSTNTVATSFDGTNWTGRGLLVDPSGNPLNAAHWSGQWFQVAGNSAPVANLARSLNGKNWSSPANIADDFTALTYNGGRWIGLSLSGGAYAAVQTSNNPGALSPVSTIFDTTGLAVASEYQPQLYRLAIGVGSGATDTMAYSTNGKHWVGMGDSVFGNTGRGIAYGRDSSNNKIWVAVGDGTNSIARSTDGGVTWVGQGASIFSTTGWGVYCNYNQLWLAGGEGTNTIAWSRDGLHWNGLGSIIFDGYAKTFDASPTYDAYFAGGSGSTNTLAYSTDLTGTSWVGLGTSVFSTVCNRVRQGPANTVVAVGQGTNTLATTQDPSGLTWNTYGTSIFSTAGYDVAFKTTGQDVWVAVGEGTNQIAYSTDTSGTNWTGLGTTVFGTGGVGLSVAWDQVRLLFIATGAGPNGSIATSPDGSTWTIAETDPLVGGLGSGIFQIDTRFIVDDWQ